MNKTIDELVQELTTAHANYAVLEQRHQRLLDRMQVLRQIANVVDTEPLHQDRHGPLYAADLDAEALRDGRLVRSASSTAHARARPARRTDGKPLTSNMHAELDSNMQHATSNSHPPSPPPGPSHPLFGDHPLDHPSPRRDSATQSSQAATQSSFAHERVSTLPGTPSYEEEPLLYGFGEAQGTPAEKNRISGYTHSVSNQLSNAPIPQRHRFGPYEGQLIQGRDGDGTWRDGIYFPDLKPMDANNIVGGPNEAELAKDRRDRMEQLAVDVYNKAFEAPNQSSPPADPDAPVHPPATPWPGSNPNKRGPDEPLRPSERVINTGPYPDNLYEESGTSDETTNHPGKDSENA